MARIQLREKVAEFKEKFRKFFVSKKKLQALENYSQCTPFQHKDYLSLIRRCMNDGFLGEREQDFLSYMVDRYEVNFLDWSHKTKWLKSEMNRMKGEHFRPAYAQMTIFDYMKTEGSLGANVPLELIALKQKQTRGLRI